MQMKPLAVKSPIQPTGIPRVGAVGIANLEEPSNSNLTDLGIKERVAWLFLEGLGVDRRDVSFSPRSPLAYMEAPLKIDRPPHPFHKTTNHRLIGVTIDDTDYPILLSHDGEAEHLGTRAGNIMLWSPVYLFSQAEERIAGAARTLLDTYRPTDWARISYPSYGHRLRHVVSFPGIYSPINPYVKPLIRSALQHIHGAMYRKDDIRVLVLGSGSGIEAIEIAQFTGLAIDCTDINPLAVANTKASALLANLEDRIKVWQSDGLKNVNGTYDYVLFCAPVLASAKSTDPNRFDPNGEIIASIFKQLPQNLRENGQMLVMNRNSIDDYVPPALESTRVLPFLVNGHSYAIHKLTVK